MESAWNWAELVEKISAGNLEAVEDLYAAFAQRVRAALARRVPSEYCEDGVHEVLLIVVTAIRHGDLRDPDRLPGFIATVTHRQVVAHIRRNVEERRRFAPDSAMGQSHDPSPEELLLHRERIVALKKMMAHLRDRDREILERFYLRGQNAQQICHEMNLTSTQFRLLKSRALARCARRSPG